MGDAAWTAHLSSTSFGSSLIGHMAGSAGRQDGGRRPRKPVEHPRRTSVTGARGVGKTPFVGSVSETEPITVETTTDVGRISLHQDVVLYLFGTSDPSQAGF